MVTRRHIGLRPLHRAGLLSFINVLLLIITLTGVYFALARSASLPVKLPKAVTSDMVKDKSLTLLVTSENIIYINGRVITLAELKNVLSHKNSTAVFIKINRRASVGRLVDVWDLCRELGIEHVNIASDQRD